MCDLLLIIIKILFGLFVWFFVCFTVARCFYLEGKKSGYTEAVRDVLETGKFRDVEEIYK